MVNNEAHVRLFNGEKPPPIDVDLLRVQHLDYYVISDGNHRVAAHMMRGVYKIKAFVHSTIDLTPARLVLSKRVMLFQEKGSMYLIGMSRELNDLELTIATTLSHLQNYDKVRKVQNGSQKHKGQKHTRNKTRQGQR